MTMPARATEGTEKLITAAERTGGIKLAELAQAELCALRAETTSLVCERTARWWARLGDARREELGGKALDLLVARKLLRLPPDANPKEIYEADQLTNEHLAPELAIILAARTGPRPVVTCQVAGQDALNWCHPRFFGITTPAGALRALVCEVLTEYPAGLHGRPTLGTILKYALMNPERTAKMIAAWARVIPNGTPTITLFAHGSQATLDREGFQIRPHGCTYTVTRSGSGGRADPPATLDEAGTLIELASALTRMAR
jgi:hypothetical protein